MKNTPTFKNPLPERANVSISLACDDGYESDTTFAGMNGVDTVQTAEKAILGSLGELTRMATLYYGPEKARAVVTEAINRVEDIYDVQGRIPASWGANV
ncbi:hypothetical protein [Methylobacillus sp.]|uniref:hypothetical protein n=1 Tax=Methylobacillus sp. TaxID=56818 RepID=UPI0012C9165E|nr:hypothetical protein [Methylobacillus sp.]MPS48496.1 hypothetical protein [Methylobacillus sp.]